MPSLFEQLFSTRPSPQAGRARMSEEKWPALIYAIGDVHGCDAELQRLEAAIVHDAARTEGEKWLVMLGDYVDRGPASAGVLDRLCAAPPEGFKRLCLAGNHELMLLDFLANPRVDAAWLKYGGRETLQSYGIDNDRFLQADLVGRKSILEGHIPSAHLDFLNGLPILLALPGTIFTHAGIRPGIPLDAQNDEDLVWIREPFLSSTALGVRVVHGHTPSDEPNIGINRIGIDTRAFATGVLTAARLDAKGGLAFLNTAETGQAAIGHF